MSRRNRRATDPVSSSASMTTRPPTMCSPPEKRSSAVTSALRSEVFVHSTRESSSLTIAVIAMCGVPFPLCPTAWSVHAAAGIDTRSAARTPLPRSDHGGQSGGESYWIVPCHTVECRHRSQDQLGAALPYSRQETTAVNNRFSVSDHGVQRHSAEMCLQHAQMLLRREAVGLPG